jgi:stage II sporulation protein GA (sporulation sigma-E factor processing peptidase)
MPETQLVFYLDEQVLLALANCLLDYLLLWATAAITRTYTSRLRLFAGSSLGTLYYVMYVLSIYGLFPFYGYLRWLPTVFLVSIIMLLVTFSPLPPVRFWSVTSHFYVISFISAGSGLAGAQLLGSHGLPSLLAGVMVAICSLIIVAQLGWGVMQRRNWRQGNQLPVDVTFGDCTVRITALLDTGNRLREPISGAPVLVVEHAALASIFPPTLAALLQQLETGNFREVTNLVSSAQWSSRFRIIPFTSMGTAGGMMIGFRPDVLTLWLDGKPHHTKECTVALSPRNLDPARMYQGLLSPDLLENVMTATEPSRNLHLLGGMQKEERTHAVTHG